MKTIDMKEIARYVEARIGEFHDKRIKSLDRLKLKKVLKRKNPYLFRAKNMLTSEQIVRGLVDAHLSSNEETLFGDWLEGLAIFISQQLHGGYKSGIRGIDLEFDDAGTRYIVAIKSGPNWGNSSQIAKMRSDFVTAKKTLRTSHSKLNIVAVNGCCYGRDNNPDKGDYFKYCGQRFWQFISNERDLYTEIIEPLGHRAKEKNDAYEESHTQRINLFTLDFIHSFCKENGAIDWEKLVRFNASEKSAPRPSLS
ncbi:MAG: hypothetical protein LBF93_07100 [Zoogloeaceae bacterium]|nr:hypothetical protein [Zoogloeaceae bacterium]